MHSSMGKGATSVVVVGDLSIESRLLLQEQSVPRVHFMIPPKGFPFLPVEEKQEGWKWHLQSARCCSPQRLGVWASVTVQVSLSPGEDAWSHAGA